MFSQAYEHDLAILPESVLECEKSIPGLLAESRTSSTTRGYYRSYKKWMVWLEKTGIRDEVPKLKHLVVAICLASLIQEGVSENVLSSALYGIRWAHSVVGVSSPTDSELICNVFEAGKRRLSVPKRRKEPIDSDMLRKMYSKFFQEGNLSNQRIICACLIAYAGFLRSSELLNIRCSDVCFEPTHMSISIEKSKTDTGRDGHHVVIARMQTVLCPVRNLEKFLGWCGFSNDCTDYVFQNLLKTKSDFQLRKGNKPSSYFRLRELFEAFKPFIPDISKLGLHSLTRVGQSLC